MVQTELIVALLVAERSRLDAAINALQEPSKLRGRLPRVSTAIPAAAAKPARKRKLSTAGRKAIAAGRAEAVGGH
jgi:hypothetical protein